MSATTIAVEQFTPVLEGLYGSGTTITKIEDPKSIGGPTVSAFFADSDGELKYAINCEIKIANSLGAALAMIPPGGAEDASAEGVVPENIAENLHEVLNIFSATFAECEGQRIVLKQVVLPGSEMSDELAEKLKSGTFLLQIECEMQRYQPGKISLLRTA